MTSDNIIRAWEDRESLSDEERALLPEDPMGQIELTQDELAKVVGGLLIQRAYPPADGQTQYTHTHY